MLRTYAKCGQHRHFLGPEPGERPACPHPRSRLQFLGFINKYNQPTLKCSFATMADATEAVMPNNYVTEVATKNISDGDSFTPPTEVEVQTIIASIKEASSEHPPPTTPSSDYHEFDEGVYWDLSSMAPLNAVSAVSNHMRWRARSTRSNI